MSPVINIFVYIFNSDTKIPELYGIKETDLFYYILFAVFIIPNSLIWMYFYGIPRNWRMDGKPMNI